MKFMMFLRWLRRVFSFLFRHDPVYHSVEAADGVIYTKMRCTKCGSMYAYSMFDQEAFRRISRRRGCKGQIAKGTLYELPLLRQTN